MRASTSGRCIRARAPRITWGPAPARGTPSTCRCRPARGSDEFLALVQHVVVPIGRDFRPGLVAISAGYDAHRRDPLAECAVDTQGFADMAASMRDLAAELDVPVLVCLEGGYDPDALAESVLATVDGARGRPRAADAPAEPAMPYAERHRDRWPALSA